MGTLALPSYGTQIDVYHENKLDPVIILEQTGSPVVSLTLIVWEDVATTDQTALTKLFGQYGSPVLSGGRAVVKIDSRQFVGSPHPTGLKKGPYTVTIDVTGPGSPNSSTQRTASITGAAATFPQLAAALNAAFSDVNVTWTGKLLIFTTTAVGSNAKVTIGRFGTLFNPASPLLGFNGFRKPLIGVSSAREILELNRTDANVIFADRYHFVVRRRRPYVNQVVDETPVAARRTEYFDSGSLGVFGSPSFDLGLGVWRLLGTNVLSGSPDTTPSWLLP